MQSRPESKVYKVFKNIAKIFISPQTFRYRTLKNNYKEYRPHELSTLQKLIDDEKGQISSLRFVLRTNGVLVFGLDGPAGGIIPAHSQLSVRHNASVDDPHDCLAAGTVVIQNNKIIQVISQSGDYRPKFDTLQFFLDAAFDYKLVLADEVVLTAGDEGELSLSSVKINSKEAEAYYRDHRQVIVAEEKELQWINQLAESYDAKSLCRELKELEDKKSTILDLKKSFSTFISFTNRDEAKRFSQSLENATFVTHPYDQTKFAVYLADKDKDINLPPTGIKCTTPCYDLSLKNRAEMIAFLKKYQIGDSLSKPRQEPTITVSKRFFWEVKATVRLSVADITKIRAGLNIIKEEALLSKNIKR